MLAAVESWVTRDHDAEWKQWVARCDYIADRVSTIPGVTAAVQREPGPSLSNRSPRVTLRWDSRKLGISGPDAADLLDKGEPRILLGGGGGTQGTDVQGDTGLSITSAMMASGDEKIVAQRILQVLSAKHSFEQVDAPAPAVTNLSGRWEVQIQYAASTAIHKLHLQQNGNRLEGTHQGDFLARDVSGTISGDVVTLASHVSERHGDALSYRFSGKVNGETLSGPLDMGEYLAASWTAQRHSV
jgi:L-seryl-tRNA(Ser) seleniumtransferase